MLDVLGEVVVLVQSESGSDSLSDSGSDTPVVTEPGGGVVGTEQSTPVEINLHRVDVAFDPVTFPADRIASWLDQISVEETQEEPEDGSDSHTETPWLDAEEYGPTPEYEPMSETDTDVDPEAAGVLATCTELLSKIDDVRLAVLHLQYSLRAGTAGPRKPRLETQDRAQRLWSWDHAGVFLAELPPCP